MALNAIDGMIAREHDQKTPLGMVLNEAGDIVSDAALYLPLAYVLPGHPGWVTGIVLGAALTETIGILGQAMGGTRQYQGPMGKSDRALWFGLVTFGVGMQWIPQTGPWEWGWGALLVLTVVTLWNRGRAVLKDAGGSDVSA